MGKSKTELEIYQEERVRYWEAYSFHFYAEVKKKINDEPFKTYTDETLPEAERLKFKEAYDKEIEKIDKQVEGYVDAIDLTKPVNVVDIPTGTVLAQRQNAIVDLSSHEKKAQWQGRWNAWLKDAFVTEGHKYGSTASSLNNVGSAFSDTKSVMDKKESKETFAAMKQLFFYVTTQPVQGLESTAKAAVPVWDYKDTKYVASGGGTQVFMPEVAKTKRITAKDPEFSAVVQAYTEARAIRVIDRVRTELRTRREASETLPGSPNLPSEHTTNTTNITNTTDTTNTTNITNKYKAQLQNIQSQQKVEPEPAPTESTSTRPKQ